MPDPLGVTKLESGLAAVRIETGTVASVNVRNMTVDWAAQYSGSFQPGIQIMTPYLHYNNGEGFTCVPEVGAICAICFPSDERKLPFVMGFLSAPEREGATVGNLEASVGQPGVETEEDLPTPNTTTAGGSTTTSTNASDASYRAGRPVLNPGDMLWQGRDENFVILRRGGVLQIGSTQICQRAYIPVRNFIRDFCENYELNTAAGSLSWTMQRDQDKPAPAQTPNDLSLILREYPQDKKASIRLSFGSLDSAKSPSPPGGGDTWVELVIAPGAVDPSDGKVSGTPVFALRIDKQGNSYVLQAQTRTEEIKGDLKQKVVGNQQLETGGSYSNKVTGTVTEEFGGAHTVKGASSDEVWSGNKSIEAVVLKLGAAGASEPAVLGALLINWLATHTHAASGSPPAQAGAVGSLLSSKVFVAK